MKNRLQSLWDEVMPDSGPCPQPDVKKVRRRVDAALDGMSRAVSRRVLRLAVLAIAVVLLTGAALAVGEELKLIPPEFNVLRNNFGWVGDPEEAIALMSITPVSVEDDNYTMTVTSSLADGGKLYFTLVIEAKNDEAGERLQEDSVFDQLRFRIIGTGGMGFFGSYDEEAGALLVDVSLTCKPTGSASVRFDLMDKGLWLNFPVKTIRSITMKVDAEVLGVGDTRTTAAPVTVDRVVISPLSYTLRYYTSDLRTRPRPYFLYKDGSILTMTQLSIFGGSGGSNYGLFDQHPGRFKIKCDFGSIQDLSLMEAIVLGDTAYPLDGGAPYEVDISAIPRPFAVPIGEKLPEGYWSVPLFAVCEGLGAGCQWDEAAGVAVAAFRDATLTFTLGSKTVQADGQWNLDSGRWTTDSFETDAAPVYRDGELWVDGTRLFLLAWSVDLDAACSDDAPPRDEDGFAIFDSLLVKP